MKRTPVASSSLAAIGYDPDINTLEVEFRNGRCYRYFAVPQHLADSLMAAKSKGRYFTSHIKDRFPVTHVA